MARTPVTAADEEEIRTVAPENHSLLILDKSVSVLMGSYVVAVAAFVNPAASTVKARLSDVENDDGSADLTITLTPVPNYARKRTGAFSSVPEGVYELKVYIFTSGEMSVWDSTTVTVPPVVMPPPPPPPQP